MTTLTVWPRVAIDTTPTRKLTTSQIYNKQTHELDTLVIGRELLEGQVRRRQRGGVFLESSGGVQQQRDRSGGHEGLDVVVGACAAEQTDMTT